MPLADVAMRPHLGIARIESGEARLWRCETLGDALQRRAHVADIECRVEVSPEHVEEAILREIAARHFSDEEEVGFADVGGEL